MTPLQTLIKRISGCYDNYAQAHTSKLPHAIHVTTPCNDRIRDLPEDFNDIFVIDETYYTYDTYSMELHHLYRYHELENKDIELISYEIPAIFSEEEFRSEHVKELHYADLQQKQTIFPIVYTWENDVFVSEDTNEIAPGILLHVVMNIHSDSYSVVEACYQHMQLISGFEEPILYQKADA